MKKLLVIFLTAFFGCFFKPQLAIARSGCCSWHGGVCGCDNSNGRQVCCDGTYSPSCTCVYIPRVPVVVPTLVTFPTLIPIPTSTPYPTFTPIPTSIPTLTPTPTKEPTPTIKTSTLTVSPTSSVLGVKSTQRRNVSNNFLESLILRIKKLLNL